MIEEEDYLEAIIVADCASGAVVDAHGMLGETIVLLQLAIKQEDRFGVFRRTVFDSLFEKISRTLQFASPLKG